jgi:2-dehydro-3-deoxy-D-arabinonate dehydratase
MACPPLPELLALRAEAMHARLERLSGTAAQAPLCPVEPDQEVWACGVTYLRSRVEREAESAAPDIYARVYEAARPEIFFKALGRRTVGDGAPICIRADSDWNVPEPELVLVVNAFGEVVGYTAGNDVSSRAIEGENPLYLPQAKSYEGACAVGPEIVLAPLEALGDLPIGLTIEREGEAVYRGETRTSEMKRGLDELVAYLFRGLAFPQGVFLMTGTGIVPAAPFTLEEGDRVSVEVGALRLRNPVTRLAMP